MCNQDWLHSHLEKAHFRPTHTIIHQHTIHLQPVFIKVNAIRCVRYKRNFMQNHVFFNPHGKVFFLQFSQFRIHLVTGPFLAVEQVPCDDKCCAQMAQLQTRSAVDNDPQCWLQPRASPLRAAPSSPLPVWIMDSLHNQPTLYVFTPAGAELGDIRLESYSSQCHANNVVIQRIIWLSNKKPLHHTKDNAPIANRNKRKKDSKENESLKKFQ